MIDAEWYRANHKTLVATYGFDHYVAILHGGVVAESKSRELLQRRVIDLRSRGIIDGDPLIERLQPVA